MAVEGSATKAPAALQRSDAATFTRPSGRLGGLQASACEQAQRADANARRLLAQLAARRYASLIALAVVGALLLGLSWTGLALRNATAARHSADRRAAVAATAVKHDQAQIAALNGQLDQGRATQARQSFGTVGALAATSNPSPP